MSQVIAMKEVLRMYESGVDSVEPFLRSRGIKPVFEVPFGKGVVRWFDKKTISDAQEEFTKLKNEKSKYNTSGTFKPNAGYLSMMAKKNEADMRALIDKVDVLHMMVERLLKIWTETSAKPDDNAPF